MKGGGSERLRHTWRNLERYGCSRDRIEIDAGNSPDLTTEDIRRQIRLPARLFSIDGGHTAENTYHDISLAFVALCPGGIRILDH